MPILSYPSRHGPLFALLVVLIHVTLGLAVPQGDAGTGPVAVDLEVSAIPLGGNTSPAVTSTGTEAGGTSTGDTVRATAEAAAVPQDSGGLQLAPYPTRPIFDNSTRFQDKKNYTDPDAPIVTSFRNSSNLTTYHIEDTEVLGDLPVSNIPVFFSTAANFAGSEPISAGNATSDAIDFAMPRILEQLEVAPEDITPVVEEASPILTEALMHLLGQSDMPDRDENNTVSNGTLTKRKWSCCKGISIKKVVDTVKDVVNVLPEAVKEGTADTACKVTAATTLGGYLAVYSQVKAQNPGPGISVTDSHMYFLFQLYGYFPLTAGLRLHFNTRKFLGFIGAYDAITFGRDMYIVDDYRLSPKPGPEDINFQTTMSTIIHEIRHCQQYRSLGWFIPAFGSKYLYQYCRAGFNYRALKFEAEAYAQDKMMDDLLRDPHGYMFFRYWHFRKLSSVLGYPVATTYRRQPGVSEGGRWELPFQYGILLTTFYNNGACWSYLTTAEVEAREKANNCRNFSGRCEPDTTTYEKAIARRECLKDENLK